MHTIGLAPLSKRKAGPLPIALVKMHMYSLVRKDKSSPLSYSCGGSTRGVICHLGTERERRAKKWEVIDGGWKGSWEQGKRDPGEPGHSRSDRSKGRQQAVWPRLYVHA
jgi:hypothetical protein